MADPATSTSTSRRSRGTVAGRSGAGPVRRGATPGSRPDAGSSRGPTRPGAAARGRRPDLEARRPRTVRLAVLATILVVLSITLVPALRSFIGQQGQIDALRTKVIQQRKAVTGLQQEQLKWNDPAYVEQQARQRLKFVRVGEKPYIVLGAPSDGASNGASVTPLATTSGPKLAWYAKLWSSVSAPDPYVSVQGTGNTRK